VGKRFPKDSPLSPIGQSNPKNRFNRYPIVTDVASP
jgi:hypothetical protein